MKMIRVLCDAYKSIEFLIFCDASERAYGACLYIRSVGGNEKTLIRLLKSKSRVSPLKPTTIPTLELCGVLVGMRLYEKAVYALPWLPTR